MVLKTFRFGIMRHFSPVRLLILIALIVIVYFCPKYFTSNCLTGAFLADKPTREDIVNFADSYGKKPYLVMVFVDWGGFIDEQVIKSVYSQDCVLFVTWEPWQASAREGIDYDGLLSGDYEKYINDFARRLKMIEGDVFIRFGHEMNGNWYPWSGTKIGRDRFIAIYRHVKDTFDKMNIANVKWVFSINWEDVPRQNHFMQYYPGDKYVDYIGIDGYNWGNTQSWNKWMSFKGIFEERYEEIVSHLKKPVMISEFSSTSSGGDKSMWIQEAMSDIKGMKKIKAFVLFNVNKETDWNFPGDQDSGKELKRQLEDDYFKDRQD